MQARELKQLDQRLEGFLGKLTAGLGRSERRRWAGVYVRGLLLDGERKSVEPMATRLGESDQDLHHFVSHSPWSADVLLEGLAKATATTPPAYWIIDETSFPKAGQHSAGVQRQYCGALGKTANCQMAVSLHRADEAAGTSQPLCWRLFLPKAWAGDAARCQRAGVPPGIVHQSKQDLAFGLLDQALGWKSPAGIVLADEAYGGSFEWRLALRARNLFYCARAVDDHRLAGGAALWRGCARAPGLSRQAGPAAQPRTQTSAGHRAEPACFGLEERHLAAGHQGAATLAFCKSARVGRTRLEAGAATRGGGQETVLIEWPPDEAAPTRYWLARLPKKKVALAKLVATAKARWRVEQDYRELKDELGLDHFEGRSWQGFHHHLALVTAAFVFLRQEQARLRRRAQKKPAAAHPAAGAPLAPGRAHPPGRTLPPGATPASSLLTPPDRVLLETLETHLNPPKPAPMPNPRRESLLFETPLEPMVKNT